MTQNEFFQSILSGAASRNARMLAARGLSPVPLPQAIELLIGLSGDADDEVSQCARATLQSWDREEIVALLASQTCPESLLERYAADESPDVADAIISNPSCPVEILAQLAASVPAPMVERILENRTQVIQHPSIIEAVRRNPTLTTELRRIIQEIEIEFFGAKKNSYAIGADGGAPATSAPLDHRELQLDLDAEIPSEGLSLEGLPIDPEARQSELVKRTATLSVGEKMRYALFGNRELRTILVRDTNKEVARNVLRSPKLTEDEVETIAAMRGVSEDILRDIGSSREWIRSYTVVHCLVKNPKTPPGVSQRLMSRLRSNDLMLLTKDRGVPEAVRHNATRTMKQRSPKT